MAINSAGGFTADEINAISVGVLDHYIKKGSPAITQLVQSKPLLRIMDGTKKSYPAAKEFLTVQVKGKFGAGGVNDSLTGFSHDDPVGFYNPNNNSQANYVWKEHHLGMEMTETELKAQGILVMDGTGRSPGDKRGLTEIVVPMMEDKLIDLEERWMVSLNNLLWGDGTDDTSALAGLRSIISDNPTTGTVGGINRATAGNEYWRNRAYTAAYYAADATTPLGGNKITSSASNGGALIGVLQKEYRQLTRFSRRPDCFLAGSDFIEAMETEMRANGSYSDRGFTGRQDGAMGDMYFKGVPVEYDPTLDDLGRAKFAYFFDKRDIYLKHLEGDWKRYRTPARPYNQFVFRRSLTATGQMVAERCRSAVVLEIN